MSNQNDGKCPSGFRSYALICFAVYQKETLEYLTSLTCILVTIVEACRNFVGNRSDLNFSKASRYENDFSSPSFSKSVAGHSWSCPINVIKKCPSRFRSYAPICFAVCQREFQRPCQDISPKAHVFLIWHELRMCPGACLRFLWIKPCYSNMVVAITA